VEVAGDRVTVTCHRGRLAVRRVTRAADGAEFRLDSVVTEGSWETNHAS
jgi:hypothetical protein